LEFGFVASSSPAQVEFRLFRPPRGGGAIQLITFSRFAGHASVLAGRLHYRDDVLVDFVSRLPAEFAAECRSSDAALALGLYTQFGSQGLARLEGDFAVVIWDGGEKCFIARRDPLGAYPLFWVRAERTIAFATELKPLLDLLPNRSINVDHLADFLMLPSSGNERAAEASAYEGVQRVLPDTILKVEAGAGTVTRENYWNWLDRIVDPGTDRLDEIASRYGDLLRDAVTQRIAGSAASHMSGGMDSTSVCLLALYAVRAGAGDPPLHALSLVYEQLPTLAREKSYVDSVLGAQWEDLVGHRVIADDILHFAVLLNPPVHDEPFAGLWAMGPEGALIDKAAELGIDTLLTGTGADDLLDIWPNYLADLLRRGRLAAAWKEAREWARGRGSTPWRILHQFGFTHLFPAWRYGLLGRAFAPHRQRSLGELDDWDIPPWISQDFARRYELAARATDNASRMYRRDTSTPSSLALHSIERRVGGPYRSALAAPKGIALSHPFLDPRLVCFGMGMQARLPPTPTEIKPVLAEAMRGVLPEHIRTRRDKRSFNEVYYLGLSRNLAHLREMIMRAPIKDFGMIEKDILIRRLEEAALGVIGPRRLQRLNLTLSLITWLSWQPAWQSRSISPTDVFRILPQSENLPPVTNSDRQ
jgi:asparagine synthase (glutamine-hydrolysing)